VCRGHGPVASTGRMSGNTTPWLQAPSTRRGSHFWAFGRDNRAVAVPPRSLRQCSNRVQRHPTPLHQTPLHSSTSNSYNRNYRPCRQRTTARQHRLTAPPCTLHATHSGSLVKTSQYIYNRTHPRDRPGKRPRSTRPTKLPYKPRACLPVRAPLPLGSAHKTPPPLPQPPAHLPLRKGPPGTSASSP
jgi:hypothetical protein